MKLSEKPFPQCSHLKGWLFFFVPSRVTGRAVRWLTVTGVTGEISIDYASKLTKISEISTKEEYMG